MKKKLQEQQKREKTIIESFAKTFNSIKRIDEVEIQWMDEPQGEEKPQVLDVDATLRAVQKALNSGAKVEINIETSDNESKFMEVLKMPMLNLVTFVEGGKTMIPRNAEFLENAEEILIDGTSLKDSNFLRYKDAPTPPPTVKPETKPFDQSAYGDPNSIYYRGGD